MTVKSEVWLGAAMRPPVSCTSLALMLTYLTTTIRQDTVLYNSNMQLKRFVMMAYCFTQQIKTVAQTINKCNLPDKNYCDTSLSHYILTHWFNFFQKLCVNDW